MKSAEAWTDTPGANLRTVRLGELNPDLIQEPCPQISPNAY
ncbi:MAG: hypothetical protein O6941_07220 [Planctomycetota bacterium]|nr:hypothetical protein [Planctomycetota bacterium]MCZ6612409.1 hypothetical protein [Planctomycetota bacterium]MCZ6736075.1 hypothetical protein [Planctomycetota bacterium]